jgi:hypothetical protein
MRHQIHSTHIGSEATHDDAIHLATILTSLGCDSEPSTLNGAKSTILDPDTGNLINIPDDVWWRAIAMLSGNNGEGGEA